VTWKGIHTMKTHVLRCAVIGGAIIATIGLFGCKGQAQQMTAEEQQSFKGTAPADMGNQMKDRAANFHGRPSGGQQMSQNGPGVPPPNAVPSGGGPAGGSAPK
jgi:hypothetical protein